MHATIPITPSSRHHLLLLIHSRGCVPALAPLLIQVLPPHHPPFSVLSCDALAHQASSDRGVASLMLQARCTVRGRIPAPTRPAHPSL